MEIDWLTVAAQIVNFLVLVWLLQRFLYRPIVNAMDRREARIADRLAAARRTSEEAEAEAEAHRRERRRLEAERERLLDEARADADALRKTLSNEVRAELDEKKRKWMNDLEAEHLDFLRALRERTVQQVVAVARRALRDMAGAELEAEMAKAFIGRLHGMDEDGRRRLADAVDGTGKALTVRSAFALPAAVRRRLTKAIHEEIAEDADVAYETAQDLACGIEVRAGSQVLSWSLEGYLDAMEASLAERLRAAARPEPQASTG